MLADEQTSPEQFEALRRMTPERRLAGGASPLLDGPAPQSRFFEELHPDWSDQRLEDEVREIFLRVET